MKRSKFTDEQILAIVNEGEVGRKVADVCRAHGITDQTYYRQLAFPETEPHVIHTQLMSECDATSVYKEDKDGCGGGI